MGKLFKLGPDKIMRICVRKDKVYKILSTYNDGPCGAISLLREQPTKSYKKDITHLPFKEIPRDIKHKMMNSKVWGNLIRGIKFLYIFRLPSKHLRSGSWTS